MALIPPLFQDCVVAIGVEDKDNPSWIASGFLYGRQYRVDEKGDKLYKFCLVTNRHVFEKFQQVYLRFNPLKIDEPARDYQLSLIDENGNKLWFAHTNSEIDVAVIPINIRLLREHAMQVHCFHSDEHVANIEKLKELGITEGDFVYVLGFPMGIVGEKRCAVIVRSGVISRIRDILTGDNQEYLIDTFIFPGNSGAPVVSKPEALAITGTKPQNASYLIGIVKAYVPYQDVAVSLQTRQKRVIFEENSGLAAVHPIDFVQELIEEYLRSSEQNKESEK